jgi:uncharacterized protein
MNSAMGHKTGHKLRSVDLAGPAGRLEAVLNEGAPDAPFAALVCHPHPPSGGNLHNKVVYHAMKALNAPEWGLELPVLRFNFRGTGLSEGEYDGRAETEDVAAAIEWLEEEYRRPIMAVGFSFGAAMTLAACCERCEEGKIKAVVALGLPIASRTRVYEHPYLKNCALPKLFLSGDEDEFAPREKLAAVTAKAREPKQTVFIPGADHFFRGHLAAMQRELAGWLRNQFANPFRKPSPESFQNPFQEPSQGQLP